MRWARAPLPGPASRVMGMPASAPRATVLGCILAPTIRTQTRGPVNASRVTYYPFASATCRSL
jgi:hypothetical protein